MVVVDDPDDGLPTLVGDGRGDLPNGRGCGLVLPGVDLDIGFVDVGLVLQGLGLDFLDVGLVLRGVAAVVARGDWPRGRWAKAGFDRDYWSGHFGRRAVTLVVASAGLPTLVCFDRVWRPEQVGWCLFRGDCLAQPLERKAQIWVALALAFRWEEERQVFHPNLLLFGPGGLFAD